MLPDGPPSRRAVKVPPEEVVNAFEKVLRGHPDAIDAVKKLLQPVATSRFGASPSGSELGAASDQAHNTMMNDLILVAEGLGGLADAVRGYRQGVVSADDTTQSALRAIQIVQEAGPTRVAPLTNAERNTDKQPKKGEKA